MGFELDNSFESGVSIKVVGVGGGGGNAVNRMIVSNVRGVDFIVVNTDKQALAHSSASHKIPIGEKITKGHGAGANPEIGQRAAEESIEEIKNSLNGADMVFVTTGMGGGTGTGAAPIVARIAQEMGILTIGIVTKPFSFEGKRRMEQADRGIANLRQYVDALVIIPNERLKQVSEQKITLLNAFEISDDVLSHGVQSITELINVQGYINLDFADVTSVMKNAGYAHMGVGSAAGKDKAELAAKAAISSPLLETSISGARGILMNITASPDITMDEIDQASQMVAEEAHEDATVIWGIAYDPNMQDEMKITIIATGFENKNEKGDFPFANKNVAAEAPKAAPSFVPATSEEEVDSAEEAPIESDDDFADLISMLKKGRTKGNDQKSGQENNGNPFGNSFGGFGGNRY